MRDVIVAERIAGVSGLHRSTFRNPGLHLCWPQVASIGMTEAKAKELGAR